MFEYQFMRMALLAILLCAPAYGLIGTLVVDMRMSFLSESLGHSALTGVALGVLLGISPTWSVVVFSLIFAILLTYVRKFSASSTDTTIAVFSAASMALGVVLLSRGGIQGYSWVLVGDLLAVSPSQLLFMAIALLLCIGGWALLYNQLLMLCLHEEWAKVRGVRVQALQLLFTCLIAVLISIGIPIIGTLVISSFVVLPAAAARNIAWSMPSYHLFALIVALFSGVLGLVLSFYLGTATGATIVLLMAACYFLSLLFRIVTQKNF